MVLAAAYQWLLFAHLLGAFALIAGAAVAAAGQLAALRETQPSRVALLLGTARYGVALVAIGSLLTIVFGLALVAESRGVSLHEEWVEWSIALWAVMVALGVFGGRPARDARRLAARLAAVDDEASDELRRAVRDRWSLTLSFASGAVAIAIIVVMVFKPGGA